MLRNGFHFLHGYNKVADNSAVNLLPLLAGKTFNVHGQGVQDSVPEQCVFSMDDLKGEQWFEETLPRLAQREEAAAEHERFRERVDHHVERRHHGAEAGPLFLRRLQGLPEAAGRLLF